MPFTTKTASIPVNAAVILLGVITITKLQK
jgi:hypothetical protein